MKLIALSLTLLLSGCAMFRQPVPVVPKWPDAPPELLLKCPDLKTVEGDKIAITEMLKIVVDNYITYYQCSNRVDGWHEWNANQKKIRESLK